MTLDWSELAVECLRQLQEDIGEQSPRAALRQARLITSAAQQILQFPSSGRTGRVPGTRELVVPQTPYIIAYLVRNDTIVLLSIEHGARLWPNRF